MTLKLLTFASCSAAINSSVNSALAGAMISPENKFWHNSSLPPWPYDLEKAKAELVKAGYEWDDQGRLYYPAPENDRRWIDSIDHYKSYETHSITWRKK